jgi:hypothetical protein
VIFDPRVKRKFARGQLVRPLVGHEGRWAAIGHGLCLCLGGADLENALYYFLERVISPIVRGPPMAVPDSSPRAFAGIIRGYRKG